MGFLRHLFLYCKLPGCVFLPRGRQNGRQNRRNLRVLPLHRRLHSFHPPLLRHNNLPHLPTSTRPDMDRPPAAHRRLLYLFPLFLSLHPISSVPLPLTQTGEIIGYTARIFSAKQSPNYALTLYILQNNPTLLAPPLFAATVYMCLGRIIRAVNGERDSIVRLQNPTKFFVAGDVLGLCVQGAGMSFPFTRKTMISAKLGGPWRSKNTLVISDSTYLWRKEKITDRRWNRSNYPPHRYPPRFRYLLKHHHRRFYRQTFLNSCPQLRPGDAGTASSSWPSLVPVFQGSEKSCVHRDSQKRAFS